MVTSCDHPKTCDSPSLTNAPLASARKPPLEGQTPRRMIHLRLRIYDLRPACVSINLGCRFLLDVHCSEAGSACIAEHTACVARKPMTPRRVILRTPEADEGSWM